jgi:hypothetical protein
MRRAATGDPFYEPGSLDAVAHGCSCSPTRNNYGRGEPGPDGPVFYCDTNCPLHGQAAAEALPLNGVDLAPEEEAEQEAEELRARGKQFH